MKIEKIHIENFGKFSDYSIDFKDGFNLVFGNNEDGKTTIMSFIRLMFYGAGTSKTDISFNLRRRYAPFSQEKMGGSIEFSHRGKSYSLSKQFGKSAKSDKVLLLDKALGTPVSLPAGSEIGEQFFSLSAGAFERSIYIGSLPPYSEDGTADLEAKLAAAAYTTDTGDGYEQIAKRITTAQNELRTPRHVGISDKLGDEIKTLKKELDDTKLLENARIAKEKEIENARGLLKQLTKDKSSLQKALENSRTAELRSSIIAELDSRNEAESLKSELGFVTSDTLLTAKELTNRHSVLAARLEEKKSALTEGSASPTTDSTLDDAITAGDEYEKARAALAEVTKRISDTESRLQALDTGLPSGNVTYMFIAAVIFTLSAIFGFFASPVFIAMLAPAVVFLLLGITNHNKNKTAATEALRLREELLSLKKEELTLRERCTQAETALRVQSERQSILKADEEKRKSTKERLLLETETLRTEMETVSAEIFKILGVELASAEEKIRLLEQKQNRLSSLSLLLSKSAFCDTPTDELTRRLAKTETDEVFKAPAEYERLISECDARINELNITLEREKIALENIFGDRRGIATLERLIAEKEEELAVQNAHYEALETAKDALFSAYTEMRQNFAPELNRLTSEFLSAVTAGTHSGATVAKDFSVRVTERGSSLPFESEYLSAGTRDQLELSLRLAISKITAGDNALPLLLDDILTQYDDGRTERAIAFLAEYAKKNQILFFTCHGDIREKAKNHGAEIKTL